MGNQGYSHDATRAACEILWSGEIGDVREVHAWMRLPSWPQGMTRIPDPTPVPDTLDWDLWLGPAAWRPYSAGQIRSAFHFEKGGGLVGGGVREWGSHCVDLCQWAAGADHTAPVEYLPPEN